MIRYGEVIFHCCLSCTLHPAAKTRIEVLHQLVSILELLLLLSNVNAFGFYLKNDQDVKMMTRHIIIIDEENSCF